MMLMTVALQTIQAIDVLRHVEHTPVLVAMGFADQTTLSCVHFAN
jgi:hypothetical protein